MEPISPKQAARTAELARREAERAAFIARTYTPGRVVADETPAERMEAERLGLKSASLREHPGTVGRQEWGAGSEKLW